MAYQWESGFASSSQSFSRYIDSDIKPPKNIIRQNRPVKPKNEKPKIQTQKKTLKSRDDLMEKIEIFACKICPARYNSKGSLNRHFTTAHGITKDLGQRKPKAAVVKLKPKPVKICSRFRCNQCGKELTSAAYLERHVASHNYTSVKPKPKVKQTKKVTTASVKINVFN